MSDLLIVLVVSAVIVLVMIGIRASNRAKAAVPASPDPRREALLRSPLDPVLVKRVIDLCTSGKKIQAIKELREATGLGLREAKDLVDAIDAGHRPANLVQGEVIAERITPARQPDLADRARKLREAGQEVNAIRLVCDETGMGLLDAQKFVRAL